MRRALPDLGIKYSYLCHGATCAALSALTALPAAPLLRILYNFSSMHLLAATTLLRDRWQLLLSQRM